MSNIESLSVSLIWNNVVLEEYSFVNKPVSLGDSAKNLFMLSLKELNLGDSFELFKPTENGKYKLSLIEGMKGEIKFSGKKYSLDDFMKNKCKKNGDVFFHEVGKGDFGYIDLEGRSLEPKYDDKINSFMELGIISEDDIVKQEVASITIHWNFVPPIGSFSSGISFDKNFLFYIFIVFLLHLVLVLFVSAMQTEEEEVRFSDIPDRFANMIIEDVEKEKDDDEDKKKLGRKKENIGKRMAGKQGKIGKKDSPKYIKTRIPKARRQLIKANLKARGVFGGMTGGGFNDLSSDNNSVAGRLSAANFNGTSGDEFVAGRGSGGTGFRGTGTGGGGTGYGRIGGTGDIDTGGGRGTRVSLSKGRKGERRVPKIKKGAASYSGFCKKSDIQRVVSRRSKTIRYCYSKELQRFRNLKGKVKLMWIIGTSGSVEKVDVIEDSIKNSRMNSCLKRQVKRWKFSKPEGGKCRIKYPFVFSAD